MLFFYKLWENIIVAIYNNMITTGIVTKYSNENVLKSIYKEKLFHILYSGHTKHVN